MRKISVGAKAPEFALPDQDGKIRSLADCSGDWVLLYFYPKDDTPGCTTEACSIRDRFADFRKAKVTVFGVSVDSAKSHAKFATKYKLPFTLLSDADKTLVNSYGVWAKKKFMGREYMGTLRHSFLIGPDGRIAKVYDAVKPAMHAAEIIADVAAFKAFAAKKGLKAKVATPPAAKRQRR